MSFGVGQSAIGSIKMNRNLLSKRNRLKSVLSVKEPEKVIFKSKSITALELKCLRNRLKKEHKIILIKQIIAMALFMFILVFITKFIYMKTIC